MFQISKIIHAYLLAKKFPDTYVVESTEFLEIFTKATCKSVDAIDIHTFKYLVGPLFVNNCHWNATIIDIVHNTLLIIDPKFKVSSRTSKQQLENWKNFYAARSDATDRTWKLSEVSHPWQLDGDNCGTLSCLFIEQIISHGCLNLTFQTTTENMINYRKQMADKINNFFKV